MGQALSNQLRVQNQLYQQQMVPHKSTILQCLLEAMPDMPQKKHIRLIGGLILAPPLHRSRSTPQPYSQSIPGVVAVAARFRPTERQGNLPRWRGSRVLESKDATMRWHRAARMIENVQLSNLEIRIAGVESIQSALSPDCDIDKREVPRGFNASQNNCESGEWRTLGFPPGLTHEPPKAS